MDTVNCENGMKMIYVYYSQRGNSQIQHNKSNNKAVQRKKIHKSVWPCFLIGFSRVTRITNFLWSLKKIYLMNNFTNLT
ncbi:hypothetical protein Hanom_Chr17g01547861 [Helianthus anomalus]